MPAPKGNKYNLGGKGTEKHFKTPEELWAKFEEYVIWAVDNPWIRKEPIKSGESVGKLIDVPLCRPLTLSGFAVYCGITLRCLLNYGKEESYKEYFHIYEEIENNCYTQKFEGAAVGAFNANIIARDLGLRDAQDHSSKDGSMRPQIIVSKENTVDQLNKLGDVQN